MRKYQIEASIDYLIKYIQNNNNVCMHISLKGFEPLTLIL